MQIVKSGSQGAALTSAPLSRFLSRVVVSETIALLADVLLPPFAVPDLHLTPSRGTWGYEATMIS